MLRKKSHGRSRRPSAGKACFDFAILTVRLKPRPFQTNSKSDSFHSPLLCVAFCFLSIGKWLARFHNSNLMIGKGHVSVGQLHLWHVTAYAL